MYLIDNYFLNLPFTSDFNIENSITYRSCDVVSLSNCANYGAREISWGQIRNNFLDDAPEYVTNSVNVVTNSRYERSKEHHVVPIRISFAGNTDDVAVTSTVPLNSNTSNW